MKIALISDSLTYNSLKYESTAKNITFLNYKMILKFWKPDILFVESAWQGHKNRWKFKIASYSDYPKRNNKQLQKVVAYAKKLGIPTVFWNKEDGVHFERFIDSAKLFDHIFTVDENCVERYKKVVPKETTVNTLMFAVQDKFHYHDASSLVKYNYPSFVGSYSHHVHNKRKIWQDMMFDTVSKVGLKLNVFDRNSNRKSQNYRYPELEELEVFPAVSYEKTAQIYREHALNLNVNTIEDSPTMFSRRLIEIIACGSVAVTNPSLSVSKHFNDYCHIVSNEEEMEKLFLRIKEHGLSDEDREMARAGAAFVKENHTWTHRLTEIKDVLGLK